jgi:hypothetical protein
MLVRCVHRVRVMRVMRVMCIVPRCVAPFALVRCQHRMRSVLGVRVMHLMRIILRCVRRVDCLSA